MIWSVDAKREGINTLFARIQDFADAFLRPMGIKLVFEIPDDVPNRNMNLIARHHVMLIYQEILTNMVKYTQPRLIEVRIRLDSNSLYLNIINHYTELKSAEPYTGLWGKRGQSTIERRLNKIKGILTLQQELPNIQIADLQVPDIYKRP
jgi:signal transduction histidine kinase